MITGTRSQPPEQNRTALPALAGCGLLLVLSLLLVASEISPGPALSCLALFYYVAFCWFIVRSYPAAFILLLWFIFVRFTTMISGVAIETGGFMPEFMMHGEATGGFVRLAAVYTLIIFSAALMLTAMIRLVPGGEYKPPAENIPWANLVFALLLALCGWAFLIGLKHGFPALTGTDRILYWQQVSSRFLYFFLGNRPLFALFLGLIYSASQGRQKQISFALFLLIMVMSLLFAEKFTSICMILFSFAAPVFLRNAAHLKNLGARLVPLGLLVGLITVPAILLAYGFSDDPDNAVSRLQTRITSQAEIWFIADQKQDRLFHLDRNALSQNIAAMTSLDPERYAQSGDYLGARHYMANYLETSRYTHYLDRGVTLTMATEGYLLKTSGWLGMIGPYLILLAFYCAYQAYLYYGIITVNPLRILAAAKLLVWANFGLNQGYFWFVTGIKSMALVALILCAEGLVMAVRRRAGKTGDTHLYAAISRIGNLYGRLKNPLNPRKGHA